MNATPPTIALAMTPALGEFAAQRRRIGKDVNSWLQRITLTRIVGQGLE